MWGREQIGVLDQLIKSGKGALARQEIEKIKIKEVPRSLIAELARLAIRVGALDQAHSVIYQHISETKPLSPEEQIQYGMCLKQFGAPKHALRMFRQIDGTQFPEALLYEAITLFSQWDYLISIPLLQQYISSPLTTDYQKLIGKVNLASAQIFVADYDAAEILINEVLEHSSKTENSLLHGNGLELLTQIHIYRGESEKAESTIKRAAPLIQQSSPAYVLFLEKWTAILQMQKAGNDLESLRALDGVRRKALEIKHWETVRDCDFFFATLKKDPYLFNRLYFGTPYQPYRDRLARFFPEGELTETFDWRGNWFQPAKKPPENIGVLDLRNTKFASGNEKINENNLIIRTLKALCLDFYTPVKPVTIFLNLFPEEKVDPVQALPRIFNGVYKLNKWFDENEIPLVAERTEDGYKLEWKDYFLLRLPRSQNFDDYATKTLQLLKAHFGPRAFSSSQALEVVSVPKRSLVRQLQAGVVNEELETEGRGSKIKYRFRD